MKYLGACPRDVTVLVRTATAGEFNSPRPPRNGSAGSNTRTPSASVRVGCSTTARQIPSHRAEGAGVERSRSPRDCAQLRRITVCNPPRNCPMRDGGLCTIRVGFTLGVTWFETPSASRHHERATLSRTTPRHSPCPACRLGLLPLVEPRGALCAPRIPPEDEKRFWRTTSGQPSFRIWC